MGGAIFHVLSVRPRLTGGSPATCVQDPSQQVCVGWTFAVLTPAGVTSPVLPQTSGVRVPGHGKRSAASQGMHTAEGVSLSPVCAMSTTSQGPRRAPAGTSPAPCEAPWLHWAPRGGPQKGCGGDLRRGVAAEPPDSQVGDNKIGEGLQMTGMEPHLSV